ncbi:MAG: OmpA family protein, partial [Alphaproteobacteria bacterium]|nr:OmpA family protein [Alphaproteobacteria bacterium]
RIAELEENAKKMKDKEQSMENKLLGAAGMGMTGAGLSKSLSAGAEQKADEAAELDMAAYLATMHCSYAPGKNVKGGEKEVELPGANSLMPLYTEYVALANDLKVRKAALGMQPGIESEAILDGATSGLYDDVALGKTGGAYASLARALSDPNSEDAKKWAAQKEATAKDKKTGTTLAAVGAIGSAVANIAINSGDDKKEKSDEINAKYDLMEKELNTLERGVNRNVPVVQACPSGTTGDGVPNCVCNDKSKDYKAETNSCQARVAEDVTTQTINQVVATEKTNDPIKITPVILKGSAVFEIGQDVLRDDAKAQLTDFVNSLKGYKKCSITVSGYTDPVGKQEDNIQLSQKRADAVKKHMDGVKADGLDLTIVTHAKGESDCYCGLGKDVPDAQRKERDYVVCNGKDDNTALTENERYAPCRRIEMSAECFKESGGENQGLNLGDIAGVVQGISGGNQLSTAVNTLMSGTDDYKKLDHCTDDGYIKDYLKYIGYELHSDDTAVVKNFEDWCKKENGRLWTGRGYILPPWAKFPSYFDAAGKGTLLVEYECIMAKKTDMKFEQAMKKYEEMKSALGADRITNYFTTNCGANGYSERGNYVLIEAIRP